MLGITKEQQLKKNKPKKFDFKKYANWIHLNGKTCVICGRSDIEIHHISDIKTITGKRRDDSRVVPLCKSHHKEGKDGIHILSKEEFYSRVMSLEELLKHSRNLLEEYLNGINR